MASEGQNTNGKHAQAGFAERVDHIGAGAQQLWGEARSAVHDLNETLDLRGRVRRHPYGTLAAAVGIGYVLGGGLFSSMTARLVRLGIRLAALPVVRAELLGMAESALNSLETAATSVSDDISNKPV
jgi:hypothetical protein